VASPPPSAEELQRLINAKGNEIKALKKEKTAAAGAKGLDKNDPEVAAQVAQLTALKAQLAAVQLGDPAEVARMAAAKAQKDAALATRAAMESIFTSRGFFFTSNEIHNPPAGFFDFGPVGCAVKQNLLQFWRNWFVLAESMLEIETPTMTPEAVFRASGHVAKFTDFMVTEIAGPGAADPKDLPVSYRADKLVEEFTERVLADEKELTTLATTLGASAKDLRAELEKIERDAGAMNAEELDAVLKRFSLKSPAGKDLSACFAFNLMFASQIGPSGKSQGYLRPETAQGMFVNFRRLYDLNSGRMPFAAAQIGPAFRNEIAPRQGLLRVREFTLAEIEHFVHPDDKSHANFAEVADLPLLLLPRDAQERGEMQAQKIAARTAVANKVIGNETLAYFMARTQLFLLKCGIVEAKLRFRQHKATEMAHYASDWSVKETTARITDAQMRNLCCFTFV
jgi:glycyl-tRNA synthetase